MRMVVKYQAYVATKVQGGACPADIYRVGSYEQNYKIGILDGGSESD